MSDSEQSETVVYDKEEEDDTEMLEEPTTPLIPTPGAMRKSKGKEKSDGGLRDSTARFLDKVHTVRTKTEQLMITKASSKPIMIKTVGGTDARLSKIIKENTKMFRPKQKPFFVSLKNVNYSVKITGAKAYQRTLFNSLPPVELFYKYILRRDKTVPWPILKDINLYFKPGTITLVLGPPGSGKSSLLRLLANRIPKTDKNISGDILFNTLPASKKHHHRDVGFLTQSDDIHIPQLTVRQTFTFAVQCQMPQGTPQFIKERRVDGVLQLLGLEHRADTVVGDELLRGVSGGEKRRVSIGVECLSKMPSLLLLDEPTNGLDAAAALDLVRFMKTVAISSGAPVVMSLLQPSYEIFCLFDEIVLLSQGEVAFFGERTEALSFFEQRGCICDLVTNPAEFLQEVVEDPEKFRKSKKEINASVGTDGNSSSDEAGGGGSGSTKKYNRDDFIQDWKAEYLPKVHEVIEEENAKVIESVTNQQPSSDPEDPSSSSSSSTSSGGELSKSEIKKRLRPYQKEYEFPAPFYMQFLLLCWRTWFIIIRDPNLFQARFFRSIVIGLLFGTLFLNLTHSQIKGTQTKPAYLFFLINNVCFSSLAYLPSFFSEKKTFFSQREGRYYRVLPYYLASIFVDLPIQIIEVGLFVVITYWMANLEHSAGRFFYFYAILIIAANTLKSVIKLCGMIFQYISNAASIASLVVTVLVLFSGFAVPHGTIGNWFIWLYWISPFQWTFQGVMINEFAGVNDYYCTEDELFPRVGSPQYAATQGTQICLTTSGDQILRRYDFWTDLDYRWIPFGIMVVYCVLFHVVSWAALRFNAPTQPRRRIGGFGRNKNITAVDKEEKKSQDPAEAAIPDDYEDYMAKDGQEDEEAEAEIKEEIDERAKQGLKNSGNMSKQQKSGLQKKMSLGVNRNLDVENARAGTLIFSDLEYSVPLAKGGGNPISRTIKTIKDRFKEHQIKTTTETEGESSNRDEGGMDNGIRTKKAQTKGRNVLLYDMNGYVAPGQMLALMGASGAGKTTLLDVLGLRKTSGKIKGRMELNGRPMDKSTNRYIGYVEQRDIHILSATVEESITYSANLRLPNKNLIPGIHRHNEDEEQGNKHQDLKIQERTREEKKQLVEELIRLLELGPIRKRLVASLSPEQKKRLTIGVEMAADPVVLFLDEPTSGLDSRGAEIVMRVVRGIVDTGRVSVICTIHQPSATVFSLFTHLLLLKKGGRQLYCGPIHAENPDEMKTGGFDGRFGAVLSYFANLGMYCEPHRNPADWLLDVSGAGMGRGGPAANKPGEESNKKKLNILARRRAKNKERKREQMETKMTEMRRDLKLSGLTNRPDGDMDDPEVLKRNLSKAVYPTSSSLHYDSDEDEEDVDLDNNENLNEEQSDSESTIKIDPNVDLISEYEKSDRFKQVVNFISQHSNQKTNQRDHNRLVTFIKTKTQSTYSVGFFEQLYYTLKRGVITTWRDPASTKIRVLRALFLGLLIGFLYYDLGHGSVGMSLKPGLIYFMMIFTLLNSIPSVAKIMLERSVFLP
eukprot:TRINITY_DN1305_c0_g2_i2.p1 TRINITY_DN1305_c0_g2~~TRINITY_DN1305_c0_g2_i2.p1  ORF type:complete len:1520 (-),score=449.12 TRINITY_DN1305_c0_g2_i2:839-5398(-)